MFRKALATILLSLFAVTALASGRIQIPDWQVFDANGDVGDGWKVYFYDTGTTTPRDTYSDSALTSANTNPVVADSAGRLGDVFVDGVYKVVLKDENDVTQATYDPVTSDGYLSELSVGDIQALDGADGQCYWAAYHTSAALGGGGFFCYDSTSSCTDDDGYCLDPPAAGNGRWLRVVEGYLTPEMFGAASDCSWTGSDWTGTDDTAIIQAVDDAAFDLGVPVHFAEAAYLLDGTVEKNYAVDWIGVNRARFAYSSGFGITGSVFCISEAVTSTRDGTTEKVSNAGVEVAVDNHGVSAMYFADLTFRNLNFLGAPLHVDGVTNVVPRAGVSIYGQAEVDFDSVNFHALYSAIAAVNWVDSRLKDFTIARCGYDGASKWYAIDMAAYTDPSYPILNNNNALHIESGRLENPPLALYIDNDTFGSGGIWIRDIKFEWNINAFPSGTAFSTYPIDIKSGVGDVFWTNTTIRAHQDTGNKYIMGIRNARTVINGIGFLGKGRWLYHQSANGLVMSDVITQENRSDINLFFLNAGAMVNNMVIYQDMDGETNRDAFIINGSNNSLTNISFRHIGTPGTMASGYLIGLTDGTTDNYVEFTVQDDDAVWLASSVYDGVAGNDDSFVGHKVVRQGVPTMTVDESMWAASGRFYGGSANNAKLRYRYFGYSNYALNPQAAAVDFITPTQGYRGEISVISRATTAAQNVVLKDGALLDLGGADVTLDGSTLTHAIIICLDGDTWRLLQTF